jgi:radical SAM superfamily enzyme
MAEYVQITAAQLALLPPETVIERLTGDGAADCLAAPLWSLDKLAVRNAIAQHLKRTGSWQGKYFSK